MNKAVHHFTQSKGRGKGKILNSGNCKEWGKYFQSSSNNIKNDLFCFLHQGHRDVAYGNIQNPLGQSHGGQGEASGLSHTSFWDSLLNRQDC